MPSSLHSDRGQNFLSNVIREVCNKLEIKKTNTSGFRPQCNSQIKVVRKSVLAALAKYCHDIPNLWDKYLSLIQFILNTTNCIDSTQFSPFFLEHGRYPKTFIDLGVPSLNENLPISASEYCAELLQNLEHAKQFAEQNIAQQKQVMSHKSLKKVQNADIQVGQQVYLYNPVIVGSKKLNLLWIGPYYVCEKLSQVNVKLRRVCDNKPMKNRIHIERLKLVYLSRDTSNLTFDATPPRHADSLPPAVVDESELPLNLINIVIQLKQAHKTMQNVLKQKQTTAKLYKQVQLMTQHQITLIYTQIRTLILHDLINQTSKILMKKNIGRLKR